MTRVEQVENKIKELSSDELEVFRNWFAQFDAELWDRQIEADAKSDKLTDLANRALPGRVQSLAEGVRPTEIVSSILCKQVCSHL